MKARDIASFLRWRLIPVRYVTKLMGLGNSAMVKGTPAKTSITEKLNVEGHLPGPTIDSATIEALRAIYVPRGETAKPKDRGAPFVNLVQPEDITVDSPLMKVAFSPEIFDAAVEYFGGRLSLDSIQMLHSFPSLGDLRESQYWHKDYGDSKSFHCIIYLNDVLTDDDGPFVYVDKKDTRRIPRAPIVRRVPDDKFAAELGDGTIRSFYGKAGESVFVDPAVCYHYGSRCKTQPRLAIFVTFNSDMPYQPPMSLVRKNAEKLAEVGAKLRPDLNPDYIRRILQLN